jgi:histidinol-phosphatase (PHP family)
MNYSSLHTHTVFCDGSDNVETLCSAAYTKGLCGIGISSHAPIFKKTGIKTDWHMDEDRLHEHMDEVRAARRRWEGKLDVFLGLELDYIKGLCCAQDADIRSLDLDFIIGSVHYLVPDNGAPLFTVDGPADEFEQGIIRGFNASGEAAMHAYWDAVAEMTALGGFDILGHVDIIRKNNAATRWFSTESRDWHCRLSEIADTISRNTCVVEINTGGLNRGRSADTFPCASFLQKLREKNVPVVITADAHRASDLDGHYDIARRALLDAGYCRHVLFSGKTAGKPVWRTEGLQEPVG